jgi:hypothetical protein
MRRVPQAVGVALSLYHDGPTGNLFVGSGLDFADRGEHALKGIPGEWQLFFASA